MFIVSEGLDGVDSDWEYPGATDIPGIPPGSDQDGPNYWEFLKLVRERLPSGKTIGIPAPASYWYPKRFPMAEVAEVVDYIIYMTYDLHGQWDYGNRYSTNGCPSGDCLQSHVNKTETEYSLAMATKAGVPANKIIIGMALYGRSFPMSQAGCWGPDCTFTGPESGAAPGRCTGTAGYISNFEIREMLATRSDIHRYSDDDGDILLYDGVQWVSWLTKPLYDERVDWITGLNFGGISDWAVDLDADYDLGDGPGEGDTGSGPVIVSPDIYDSGGPVAQCYPPCTFAFPPWQLPTQTTISIPPVIIIYEENWETTIMINGGIVTTPAASVTSTVITVPPVTTTAIELWNIVWTDDEQDDDDDGVLWLTSSVTFPPITLTRSTTSGISRPPVTWTYSPGPHPTPRPERDPEDPNDPGAATAAASSSSIARFPKYGESVVRGLGGIVMDPGDFSSMPQPPPNGTDRRTGTRPGPADSDHGTQSRFPSFLLRRPQRGWAVGVFH
ncbi:hypothetical protein DL771_005526 [Monosporascus sp. 5C6A]|nr:hypothetical protein DL771_005526 [Monosporascus sp. 5C6A]